MHQQVECCLVDGFEMKRIFCLILIISLMGIFQVPTASAVDERRGVTLPTTFIVGDSTTWRIEPKLSELRPDWHIDALQGRPVKALRSRIKAFLEYQNPNPEHFIMALGTNRSEDWTAERYRRALALLPNNTKVYMMLVVRTGEFQAWKDETLIEYNRWSRNLAQNRHGFYVINWRGEVLSDPTLNTVTGISSLLEDGTHQSGGVRAKIDPNGAGVDTYIDLILNKVPS